MVRAIYGLGVVTVSDFRFLWKSSQACYEELERLVGRRLEAPEALKLAVIWTRCRGASLQAAEALGQRVALERQSSLGGSSRLQRQPAEPPPMRSGPPSNKVRRLTPSGHPAPPLVSLVTYAAQADVHAREDALKQAKLDALFQLLVEHVVNASELGLQPDQMTDPLAVQAFKNTLMAGPSRLSGQRLGALVSAYKRWLRWCTSKECDPKQPTPLQLAEFFRFVAAGGPTAASSMHASLRWFADSFGASLPMSHWAVKHFRFHAAHHTGKQAPELEPWEFINLTMLLGRVQDSHKILVAMLLMVAVGCIRFEHVQRSTMMETHGAWLEFSCSQGKARKQGARPGYRWGLPQVTMHGQHLTKILGEFFTHEMPPDSPFLVPALELSPEDLWEVTEATAFISNKAMTRARFLEVMRGALVQVGVDFPQAQASTYNRLRRFLPTMANVMEMPDLDLQSVGNWTDLPSGGGREPGVKKARGAMPMGVHYAGSRVLRSLQVKQRCVDRLMALYARKRPDLALTEEGFLCRDAWLWPEVAFLHRSFPEEISALAATESLGAIPVEPGALAEVEARAPPSVSPLPVADQSDSGSSSSDTSSSASDLTADGHDLCGVLADDTAPDEVAWFRQGKKTHVVREEVEGRLVPSCRDFAFIQDAAERGRGFTGTPRSSCCERCLSRMPRGLYLSLAEYGHWVL